MSHRWALITGASAGIGQEFARQLSAMGLNLILVARRTEPMALLASQLKEAHGIEVLIFAADLSLPTAPAVINGFVLQRVTSRLYRQKAPSRGQPSCQEREPTIPSPVKGST